MVIREFGWNYLAAGWVFAGSAAGFFVSTFVTGMLLPTWGGRNVMLVGLILQGLGIGLFGYFDSLVANLIIFIVLGLGQGAVEVTTNVSVVNIEAPGKSRLMNLVHSAFTVGAMIAPFLAGFLMASCLHRHGLSLPLHVGLDLAGFLASRGKRIFQCIQ